MYVKLLNYARSLFCPIAELSADSIHWQKGLPEDLCNELYG